MLGSTPSSRGALVVAGAHEGALAIVDSTLPSPLGAAVADDLCFHVCAAARVSVATTASSRAAAREKGLHAPLPTLSTAEEAHSQACTLQWHAQWQRVLDGVVARLGRCTGSLPLVTIHAKARTCRTYGPGCSPVVPPCPTAYGGLRMCRSRIPSSPEGGTRPRRAASPAGQGRPVLYALAGSCDWLDCARDTPFCECSAPWLA